MNFKNLHSNLKFTIATLALVVSPLLWAQPQIINLENPTDDSTIIYPADYFADFSPVSVSDMINRIPGIGLAMGRGGNNGRGLGSGEGEILINGQRTTGKNNSGQNQLSRISADQVSYIEIIRGTSEELDIRSGGQVVNIVLLDSPSRTSTSAELRTDRLHDGTIDPGGQVSFSGQTGNFNYLFHLEADPRYRASESEEYSYDPDFNLQEVRKESNTRDETEYQTSVNLGYTFDRSIIQFNALYEARIPAAQSDEYSTIKNIATQTTRIQTEDNQSQRNNWEIGGDYEYSFASGNKYRFLFIVNDRDFFFDRNRFDVANGVATKNLFLGNFGRDRERIARTSYTFDLDDNQGIEFGFEGAQTIRDSKLSLGLDIEGTSSPAYGNLVPVNVDNSGSTVEEIRFESFAVHNWQINPRMSLESSLILEDSTIEQSGDVTNSRDFQFVRPKIDYRFDITPSLQLRAGIEKDVSQLSFSDFSASVDGSDEDQDTQAGNPEIVQEQSWRYELNLELRLPNNLGVVNSQFYYRDIEDVIDKVDVSPTPNDLQSARGNIGAGKRYGLNLDVSTKLDALGLENALFSTGIGLRDSEVFDPFLGTTRRQRNNGRWSARANYRHDVTNLGFSYGLFYSHNSNGSSGRKEIDIIDIEERKNHPNMSGFIEKKAFGNYTFRLEANNLTDNQYCRTRTRFLGATAAGIVEEVEDYCNGNGLELSFKVRTTF
ncbi:MAG: TonB-dependent receptor plug domain-containing protein [Gammaproteobacteria bacterium]|nr:TonB-dependent receptor plug domain-containing protein [Gammaproteobacteria bacterium]